MGIKVSVVTTKNHDFLPKQVLPINKEIELKRIYSLDYNFIKGLLRRGKKLKSNVNSNKNSFSLSFRILDTFPFNVIFGLGGLLYIFLALIYIFPRRKNFTHIFSSFRPYSDHFIAYVIKRVYPDIFWIADFRDIHIDMVNKNVLSVRYQNYINKKIFKRADLMTSVSQGYMNYIKEYNDNRKVIFNGYDDSLVMKFSDLDTIKFEKFTISHVGSLYGGRRDPSFLFEVISELISDKLLEKNAIELNYVGSDGALWMSLLEKYGIANIGRDMGLVEHDRAIQVQKSTHLNLMITWATTKGGTFPAKFLEYLVSDRPILLLVNGEDDPEFESIFQKYDIGELVYARENEKVKLKKFILSQISLPESEKYIDPSILKDFHWSNRIQSLLESI